MRATVRSCLISSVLCAGLVGCGGGSTTSPNPPPPPPPTPVPTSITATAGTGQTGRIGTTLSANLTFVVRDQNQQAMANVGASFSVTGGGALATTSGTTDGNGSVSPGTWTLGTTHGSQSVTATVAGHTNVTASVTATARYPYWTVMVYMAADNTLTQFGAVNLIQMANAGVNPEVQVVVQAEFNPQIFAQFGCTAQCVDRPNFNTFRYVMDGSVKRPPNNVLIGPATDIGNVDMTDPIQLRSFVQWAQQTKPSEHTILVLWNHGGDENGLIEDNTSAPGTIMSLSQLTTALTGLGTFDIIDFQMCLMAGFEPLTAVRGLTKTVVASEETEIVNGWDFGRFLHAVYQDPLASATLVATRLADAFDAAYEGTPWSETIAAFNMDGFSNVDGAIAQLGTALTNAQGANLSAIASASASAQRYEIRSVVDLGDLSDSLVARIPDAAVGAAARSVRLAVASPGFLLTNHSRTGVGFNTRNLSRSRGLHIVMPTDSTTEMNGAGPGSLASYQAAFPNRAWTRFLSQWVPATQSLRPFVDLGTNTTTAYVVWDTAFVRRGSVEMLLLEPDGNVYGPAFGTISPSGHFSPDAVSDTAYYEGWASNRFVESGKFYFLAWLAADSSNYQPRVNFEYQIGGGPLHSLYGPGTYPQLSFQRSFRNDPSATDSRILANYYSDIQVIATYTSPAAANIASTPGAGLSFTAGNAGETSQSQRSGVQIASIRRAFAEVRRIRRERTGATPETIRRSLREALTNAPGPPRE